jgi:peptide/nickel transport system substrate-binding protein
VYVRGGQRLASSLLVRADYPERVRFATLVAGQARDCGIDIAVGRQSFDDLLSMIHTWPHDVPGTNQPFDLYLGGWFIGVDPDDAQGVFGSDRLTSAMNPDDANYIGFSDPEVDRLLAQGAQTYDIEDRAPVYQRIQEIVAAKRPYIFAYAFGGKTALAAGVGSTAGDLDLTSPFWNWRLTELVVQR